VSVLSVVGSVQGCNDHGEADLVMRLTEIFLVDVTTCCGYRRMRQSRQKMGVILRCASKATIELKHKREDMEAGKADRFTQGIIPTTTRGSILYMIHRPGNEQFVVR